MADFFEPLAGYDFGDVLAMVAAFTGFGFGLSAVGWMVGHVVWLIVDVVR